MQHVFTSANTQNKEQSWRFVISEMFGRADIQIADEDRFHGEIRRSPLGQLDLTQITSSFEDGKRTREHLSEDVEERFLVVFLKSGQLHISQFGRDCDLTPGMFTIFDCSAPYIFRHTEPTSVINVGLPGSVLRSRIRNPARFIGEAKSRDTALGRVMSSFVDSIAHEIDGMPDHAASRMSVQLADMIAIALESCGDEIAIGNSAVQSALHRRCTGHIERNLGDHELDPAKIACAMGISIRYLHAIFQSGGESVGDCLRRLRLARAYDALVSTGRDQVAVKEIAYKYGFRNPAHFATAFKSRFGLSPSEIRRGVRASA